MRATYEYGPRGNLPPLKLHWYQGHEKPEAWQTNAIPKWESGVLFIGDKGMLRTATVTDVVLFDFLVICSAA